MTGNLSQVVTYPPVYQWQSNEIHVNIQIEVYKNGTLRGTLGPGQDYDIFCNNPPTTTAPPFTTTPPPTTTRPPTTTPPPPTTTTQTFSTTPDPPA